jgi:hypothetical protein
VEDRAVTTYWVPAASGDDYAEVRAENLVILDVCCDACHKGRGENRRMQRFACPSGGGLIGVLPYRKGYPSGSPFRVYDGVPQWHVRCRCSRERPVDVAYLTAGFAEIEAGLLPARRRYI